MVTLPQRQSFHPPAQPHVGASYPDPVLLTVRAFIADRTNETTATSSTREGHRIQVSFFAAKPPALSYLCVYCPDAAFTGEPRVIATQGNLILLGTGIRSSSDPFREAICYDHFVYSADGTGGASLDLLPNPGRSITRANVGLLASGSCGRGYAVVTLNPDPSCKRYILRVHHEKTGLWRKKIVSRKVVLPAGSAGGKGLKDEILPFTSTKVIALQGSNVAWVDLREAVLLCDVLEKDPIAYYIPLPEPLNDRNKEYLESPGDPCFFRDAAVGGQNLIKFVEMEYRYGADFAPDGWKAITYSWAIGSKNWCIDSVVDFEDVLENSGSMLSLLRLDRSTGVESNNIPPLCVPSLCDRDNILYLMSKPNRSGPKGSVVMVDTAKKTLKSVTTMTDERVIGYALTYLHCTFANHFNDVADVWPKMEDQTCNKFLDLYIERENFSESVDKMAMV